MTKNDLGDSDNDKDMTLTVKMTMTNMNFSTNGLHHVKTHVLETGSNRTRPCLIPEMGVPEVQSVTSVHVPPTASHSGSWKTSPTNIINFKVEVDVMNKFH